MNAGRYRIPFWTAPVAAAAVAALGWWWQRDLPGTHAPPAASVSFAVARGEIQAAPAAGPEMPAVVRAAEPLAAGDGWERDPAAWDELTDENERLRRHLDDLLEWIVENLGGRFPVPEPLLAHLRIEALGAGYALHPDLVDMLRIAPGEEMRINAALAHAARLAEWIEESSAWVEWRSATEAALHLPGDPGQGEAIRMELRDTFDDTLGPDRGARLWTVAESSLSDAFGAFGAGDRVIVFSLAMSPDGASERLRIRDERRQPGGDDAPTRITAEEWLAEEPPAAYARHIRLLTRAEEGEANE